MSSGTQIAVKIKVSEITPRIQYVCDFIFLDRKIPFKLTTADEAVSFDYSREKASTLLYTDQILQNTPAFHRELQVFEFDGMIDYFASIFYVLTRMEEYGVNERDHHGRFSAKQSAQMKYGLLDKVICDRWAVQILKSIPEISIPDPDFSLEPTFDIDNTFAYKYKVGVRRKLSILRDRIQGNKIRLQERRDVDNGGRDPYDTFDLIRAIAQQHSGARVFWLVESKGKFDRNLDVHHPVHQQLIRELREICEIGIHPSYGSFCNVQAVAAEKEILEKICGSVNRSRQHFLRLNLPDSYRTLIAAGIEHDYTMGFADQIGFRAGTARSFPWFDLESNEVTRLIIHPFAYMDGTLNEYLHLSPEKAKDRIKNLFLEVKSYGGVFGFVWHNETIGEYKHWKGWKSVLDYTLSLKHE